MEFANILRYLVSNSIQVAIQLGRLGTTRMHFSEFWRQRNPNQVTGRLSTWWGQASWSQRVVFSLCPHMLEGEGQSCGFSSVRAPVPGMRLLLSGRNYLLEALLPNAIVLGCKIPTNTFGEGRHKHLIYSVAYGKWGLPLQMELKLLINWI